MRRRRARAALFAALSASVAGPVAAQNPPGTSSPAAGAPAATGAAPAPAAPAPGTKPAPAPGAPPAATGEAPKGSDQDATAPQKPPSAVGGYSWTDKKPGRAHAKRRAPVKRVDPNAPLATYPGFRMLPSGESQLSLRVSKAVDVQVRRAGGSLVFFLPGVRVGIRNNTNPLITTHFNTPLSMARLMAVKQGAELVVELRESVQPTHKVTRGPYGTMELEVLLPRAKRDYSNVADPEPLRGRASASSGIRGTTGRGPRRRGPEM